MGNLRLRAKLTLATLVMDVELIEVHLLLLLHCKIAHPTRDVLTPLDVDTTTRRHGSVELLLHCDIDHVWTLVRVEVASLVILMVELGVLVALLIVLWDHIFDVLWDHLMKRLHLVHRLLLLLHYDLLFYHV